jgi:hypothetical protein
MVYLRKQRVIDQITVSRREGARAQLFDGARVGVIVLKKSGYQNRESVRRFHQKRSAAAVVGGVIHVSPV